MKKTIGKAGMLAIYFVALIAVSIACCAVGYAADYYTIRIEYRFSDDSVAHDPYVAVLPKDSDVDLTVKNPIIPGYKPVDSLESGASDASQTILNYPALNENKTVTVYYIADLVHYQVRYFKQNVQDDLYTEDLSLTNDYYEKSGYTGSYPEELNRISFSGFTSLYHESDVIAADGSTVFKLYYDRNYYLVDFLLGDGGYGIEPVYAKHGTTFNIGTPKRAGYTFKGWVRSNANGDYLDNSGNVITETQARVIANPFTSGVVPIGDSFYRAVWQPEQAKFSVIYWSENPGDNGYSVIAEKEVTQIVENNAVADVHADMTITPDTYIKNNAGTANIQIKDFFSLNLNYANPSDPRNNPSDQSYDPDFRYDSDGNKIDFNDISKGVTEEYKGNGKLFELNTASNMPSGSPYITDTSKTVAGDGTTNLNIYFKRRPFTLKFYYARVHKTNGKICLTNSTKAFSRQSYNGTNYMSAISKGTWVDGIADTLPTLKQEYVNAGYISQQTEDYGDYTYYYYQVTSKYNAPLKNKWFVDSVNPVHKKNYAATEMCIPGSWAVENGTNYYDSHQSVGNYTIKGMYEKLGKELMFKSRTTDYTELHYLVSWTNTSTTNNWNYGINRVLRFKYRNYVELTSYEKNMLREYLHVPADAPDRAIPSARVFDPTKNDYIKDPATGEYIDLEIVNDNVLVSGTNAPYQEIVKFNSSTDPNAQPKLYGLKNVFEEIDTESFEPEVDTVDSGDQYDRTKSEATRTANVRTNQTPTDLSGFQIENYRLNNKGQIILDPTNTTVDWSEDTDTDRRATIRFFYRRRTYNLFFRSGSELEETSFTVPYGEYVNYTTSPQFLIRPAYYNEDLRGYYSFRGWYFDPTFSAPEATTGFAMPPDDITLYAKWSPVDYHVSFYNDYGDYSDSNGTPVHTCTVPYNTKILTADIPIDEEHAALRLTPTTEGARFAGWYYTNAEGNPARFDPENLPVKNDLRLYAAWESTQTAEYRIRYVEKDTGIEVADPDVGTLFVSKTKTFSAKTGDRYNAAHQWVDNQPNWWPVISSHSILVEPNTQGEEYAPNEFSFEYIRKTDPVYYAVQYLDAETNQPIQASQSRSTYYAAVTETAPSIEGYVADSVTKARVLSASELSGAEAREEELRNNVIIFFYTKSDTTAIYQVDHYIQSVDGRGYELYNTETVFGTKNESISVNAIETDTIASGLTSSGFSCDHNNTTISVDGAAPTAAGSSFTLTGAPTIVSVYYDRNTYGYTVKYIDYDQEKRYDSDNTLWNGELFSDTFNSNADKQPLGQNVAVSAPALYTYTGGGQSVNYTRISDNTPVLTIRHDDPDTPTKNILKVYYKEDKERKLNYRIVCDRETTDTFAVLSQSSEIVTNLAGVNGSTVSLLEPGDREYEFLGWFSTPEATEANRLTDASTTHYAPATFPGADATYYAVFHQKTVAADVQVRYNDSGVYTNDSGSTEDTDGSVTGYIVTFTQPDDYVSGTQTALDQTADFVFDVTNADGKLYRYEFAGWYTVDNGTVTAVTPAGESGFTVPRTADCRYIAMFKKRASVDYEIQYRFTTRTNGDQSFIIKDTLSSEAFADALSDSGSCELSDAFILSHAPYESNYGETLTWSDTQIVQRSSAETGIVTTVTAVQNKKTVYANYRLSPSDVYSTIATTYGANRETDPALEVINAEDQPNFSYWEIRKTDGGDVIAKCYDAWFSFCMMDSYYISPVYDGTVTHDQTAVTLTHLDYTRNRWTDENGAIDASGETDLLFSDFEIAFEDNGSLISHSSAYHTGVVLEYCATVPENATFDPTRDYMQTTDQTNLAAAINAHLDGDTVTQYIYKGSVEGGNAKRRTIQFCDIPTSDLTNKNRVEFGKVIKNAFTNTGTQEAPVYTYTNSRYLLKAYAYLVKDGQVTFSNPVYVCYKGIAAQDDALQNANNGN